MRFKQVHDGEWVKPIMRGYRMQCCGCGLIHTINFNVIHHGRGHKVLLQAFRHPRKRRSVLSKTTTPDMKTKTYPRPRARSLADPKGTRRLVDRIRTTTTPAEFAETYSDAMSAVEDYVRRRVRRGR